VLRFVLRFVLRRSASPTLAGIVGMNRSNDKTENSRRVLATGL
jgi:hypothetical protein